MPTPILMPALSPTMEEGTLAKWKVKEGDKVSSGDVIAEIETDKAMMEVEAVDEGVVGKIVIPAGTEHVKVNATIAILLGEGESAGEIAKPAPAKANGGGGPAAAQKPASAPAEAALAPAKAAGPGAAPFGVRNGRVLASPLARRLAKEAAIDLQALTGSGPHGRIVKRDLDASANFGAFAAKGAAAQPLSALSSSPAGLDVRLYPAESYASVKNDMMRRTIAKRLRQSFNDEVPHFPLNIDIELTRLLEARAALNALSPKDGEGAYKLSVNDFVIKASALALKKTPNANATYTEEAILLHKHADIGVAVAIEGGLITPIVWKAETKGLKQISAEIRDLAARARARKLKPEEYMGGTFSVSNLGMFGITSFSSIVNQPQGAILSVGAGEERAVVRGGAIVARTMMTVTLTCDHRVVDGAVGAEFLAAFKQFMEEPSAMLL